MPESGRVFVVSGRHQVESIASNQMYSQREEFRAASGLTRHDKSAGGESLETVADFKGITPRISLNSQSNNHIRS